MSHSSSLQMATVYLVLPMHRLTKENEVLSHTIMVPGQIILCFSNMNLWNKTQDSNAHGVNIIRDWDIGALEEVCGRIFSTMEASEA